MNVSIKIIEFFEDIKGSKLGVFDFELSFEGGRTKTFYNVSLFKKDNKHWFSFIKVKRGEEWVDVYKQNPGISKEMYKFILDKIMDHISPSVFDESL